MEVANSEKGTRFNQAWRALPRDPGHTHTHCQYWSSSCTNTALYGHTHTHTLSIPEQLLHKHCTVCIYNICSLFATILIH